MSRIGATALKESENRPLTVELLRSGSDERLVEQQLLDPPIGGLGHVDFMV